MRFSILTVCLVAASAPALFAADVVADFSATSNPNGPYTYGLESSLGGTFQTMTGQVSTSGYAGWYDAAGSDNAPGIIGDNNGTTNYSGTVRFDPDYLDLNPSDSGDLAVLRYTVADTGLYTIDGNFHSQDTTGATTGVHILLDGVSLFSSSISGNDGNHPFALTQLLTAGSTVDFAVDNGGNGYAYDNTGLQATLTDTTPLPASAPEPASLLLLGAGLAAFGALRKLRRS